VISLSRRSFTEHTAIAQYDTGITHDTGTTQWVYTGVDASFGQ